MNIIRTKNYVPDIYVRESRDFQLFTRLLDITQNSIKYDIDTIPTILDSEIINDDYTEHLSSKLGFFPSTTFSNDTLRFLLASFPDIIRYKGSMEGVKRCINVFSKINGITTPPIIEVTDDYVVRIGLVALKVDTTSLTELLSYVLPTGYLVEIYFYKQDSQSPMSFEFGDVVDSIFDDSTNLTSVRSEDIPNDYGNTDNIYNKLFNTVQLSMVYKEDDSNNEVI